MKLFPLQFIAEASNSQTVIAILLVAVFFLFIVIAGMRGKKSKAKPRMRRGHFRWTARHAGLNKLQIQLLERGIKNQEIKNPIRIFDNEALLNKVLKSIIEEVQASDRGNSFKETLTSEVFAIKRSLSNKQRNTEGPSSKILEQGQELSLSSKHAKNLQSMVTASLPDHLAVELPTVPGGSPLKAEKGETLGLRLIWHNGKIYQFASKILDVTEVEGVRVILINQVKSMREVQMRRYPRKEMNKPCYFQKVEIVTEGSGRRMVKKAVVQRNQGTLGQIEDLSVGGCAVFSRSPLAAGSLIKLAFDVQAGQTIQAYGKIIRTSPEGSKGAIMHIAFTRVSRKHLIGIQAFVYGLAGPEEQI